MNWYSKTTEVPEDSCPYCGKKKNRATHPTMNVSPKENDIAICSDCMEISKYDKDLKLVKMTKEEIDSLPKETKEQLELAKADAPIYKEKI